MHLSVEKWYNTKYGKNRLGDFINLHWYTWQPIMLQIRLCPNFGQELAKWFKHCLIADQRIWAIWTAFVFDCQCQVGTFIELIEWSIKVKAHIVQSDEQERNLRALLDLVIQLDTPLKRLLALVSCAMESVWALVYCWIFLTCQASTSLDISIKHKLLVNSTYCCSGSKYLHLVDASLDKNRSLYDKWTHVTSIEMLTYSIPIKLSSCFPFLGAVMKSNCSYHRPLSSLIVGNTNRLMPLMVLKLSASGDVTLAWSGGERADLAGTLLYFDVWLQTVTMFRWKMSKLRLALVLWCLSDTARSNLLTDPILPMYSPRWC